MSREQVITLPKWKAALAAATTTPAKAVFLGTSSVQGANATDIDRRFHQIICNKLARDYNSSKYIRYYSPQADLTNTYTSYFTYTDGAGSHALVSEGLSLRTVTLTNGAKISITVTGSAFTFLYVKNSTLGTPSIDIDSVAQTAWPVGSVAADSHDGAYSITGLSLASHTIDISAPVSGSIKFTGLVAHGYASGDPTKGIYFYNSGHGGYTTTDFVGSTNLFSRITSIDPQLVYYMPGTNDFGASMDPVTYQANVTSIITSLKAAAPNADILLVTPYKRFDLTPTTSWTDYRAANQSVASANGCAYIDLTNKYPTSQTLDSADLIDTDSLHQTDAGHSYGARLLYPAFI